MTVPAYRLDGRPATREAFYAVACDPRRSVVVEACAGAGKTWMLVSRIVRALLAGAQPQEILAITFTRKAAGEMRTRLADWLRAFAQMSDAQRVAELCARGLGAAQAQSQTGALQRLHQQVLASGRAVEVRTFHAWFSQLLRAAPLDLLDELGLASAPELIEDLDDLRPELLRRFHAAVLADPALHAHYTALVATRGRHTLLNWLMAAWDRRIEVERADRAGTLERGVPPALADGSDPLLAVAALRDDALALARRMGASGKALQQRAAEQLEAAFAQVEPRAVFDMLLGALYTEKGELRQKIGDVPQPLLDSITALRDADAQQRAHDEHRHMVALSRCLLAEYAALKRRRALVDMADLEQVALTLLADTTLSGWVQQRLDTRVRHLLIDEFQDTSPLQWQALHAWLSAYAGAGGGRDAPSVFIVGDPKQSIYRFRRAEPRVFEAARRFVVDGLQGQVLECDHTRRNAPAVLAAVNTVFGRLHAQGDFPGWRSHSTEVADVPRAGVRALPAVERPPAVARGAEQPLVWRPSLHVPRREPDIVLREAEAKQVAHGIAALLRDGAGIGAGEVMVLCRKRESLQLAADALQALHIPCTAPQDVALTSAPEVRDLIALLDVLASPGHALSLAQALKSPLFGAGDTELLALAQAATRHGGWWSALMAGAVPALAAARELLARWHTLAQALPPHDLLDRIVHESDLHVRLAAVLPADRRADAHDAVNALLAQSLELAGGRYTTVYGLVRALKLRTTIKHRPAVRADAVRLLTIHGAKGLEARVVFVMDTDPERRNVDTATLLVDWPVERDAPASVAFLANENRCPPSLRSRLQAEWAAREREERNGLYVAMTRASEQLVFSHTPPFRGSTGPSWWNCVAELAQPWAPPIASSGLSPDAPLELAELPPAPPLPAGVGSEPASPAAALGRALHRVLEWAATQRTNALSAGALAACAEQGLPRSDGERVERLAAQVLASPQAARFFDPSASTWAGNEVPLSDAGDVLRVDRLVRLADAWWVLDYKLEHRPEEVQGYRSQLARYRRAVQALVGDQPVRAAFIAASGAVVELEKG
jgi:ATP-dependent helicase/nuclease subunit A